MHSLTVSYIFVTFTWTPHIFLHPTSPLLLPSCPPPTLMSSVLFLFYYSLSWTEAACLGVGGELCMLCRQWPPSPSSQQALSALQLETRPQGLSQICDWTMKSSVLCRHFSRTRRCKSRTHPCILSNWESPGFSAWSSILPPTHHLCLPISLSPWCVCLSLWRHQSFQINNSYYSKHLITFAVSLFKNNVQFTGNLQEAGALTYLLFIIQLEAPHFKLCVNILLFGFGN